MKKPASAPGCSISRNLLRSFELLQRNPTLLAHYRQRFGHLLVDEFQDTNTLQYRWLRQLAGAHGQMFVVGDDDQSIYGWRGARADHLQRFLNDYPQAQVIRLEQNYRSTATILEAANALIARNSDRLGKTLWTEGRAANRSAVIAPSTSAMRPTSWSKRSNPAPPRARRGARWRSCTGPTPSRACWKRR